MRSFVILSMNHRRNTSFALLPLYPVSDDRRAQRIVSHVEFDAGNTLPLTRSGSSSSIIFLVDGEYEMVRIITVRARFGESTVLSTIGRTVSFRGL